MPRTAHVCHSLAIAAGLVVLGAPRLSFAQPGPTETPPTLPTMTLAQALAYARVHQPALHVARARLRVAEMDAQVPRAQWQPSVGATAQLFAATMNNTTGTYVGTGVLAIPRIGGTRATGTGTFMPSPSTFVGIGASQELFDFGRIAAQSAAADIAVEVARSEADTEGLDIDLGVEEGYFAVLGARAVVDAAEGGFARALAHRDYARARVTSGMRPPIELTRAEADLMRFDVGRIRARGGLEAARAVFAAAVGSPEATLDATPGAAAVPEELPSLAAAKRMALSRDPAIREAVARLRSQEASTRAIGAELRPDLSLTATLSGRAGGAAPSSGELPTGGGWLPVVPNWNVGIVFTWPLFDATISARREASRAREEARSAAINVAQERIVAAVGQALLAVDVARRSIPALERATEAAKANYDQADARFREGVGTSVEVADAEALRTEAEIQLALGRFQVARARANFGRAIAEGK